MKRTISILTYILLPFLLLLPLGVTITYNFGYTFELGNYAAFAVITALLVVTIAVLCTIAREPARNLFISILFVLFAPLSLANATFYMFRNNSIWVVMSMLICIIGCHYLAIRYGKPPAVKIIGLVISALMIPLIGFVASVWLVFGSLAYNMVVQTVESPNGEYYAEVVDSDQGAMGGDTIVYVYENRKIDVCIFRIFKKPRKVYDGEWKEHENMKIYWTDDNRLVINSTEYILE